MAITKEKKREIVEFITTRLEKSETAYFTDFTGVDVNNLNALRRSVRESGGRYFVAKHSLVKLAFDNAKVSVEREFIEGVNGLVIVEDEPVGVAKALKGFKDANKTFSIKGGLLEGSSVSEADIIKLAKTPPREELMAKMLGSINAPVSGFVSASAAIMRKVMYVLNAIAEGKEE
ncbi:MAG: 50S ribosomal protein L10 [bacterium]|nr:50S ribosomal protein L10 [bacterium]